jgi:hypothetical protein
MPHFNCPRPNIVCSRPVAAAPEELVGAGVLLQEKSVPAATTQLNFSQKGFIIIVKCLKELKLNAVSPNRSDFA